MTNSTLVVSENKLEPIGLDNAPVLDPSAVAKFIRKHGKPVTEAPAASDDQKQIKGSIIKSKYKAIYRKNNYSCGDLLADELKAYITVFEKGKPPYVDLAKLHQVAITNGVWKDRYKALNKGQQRMTIGNCLRNKYKNGDKLDIGGVVIYDEALQITED